MNQSPETAAATEVEPVRPTQYRLVYILYIFTLIAASSATLGIGGTLIGLVIGIFWTRVFLSKNRPRTFFEYCIVYFVLSALIMMLIPVHSGSRRHWIDYKCSRNLEQIGKALHNYHASHGSFPPAYLADDSGKPMHSWRVLLLPFMNEQALYKQYNFNEPWDGPNNIQLLDQMPEVYACPTSHSHHQGCSSYVAVLGPKTVWPGAASTSFAEITDGTEATLMLVEINESCTPWLEPKDISYEKALMTFASTDTTKMNGHVRESYLSYYSRGHHALLADGRSCFVPYEVEPQILEAMLGKADLLLWSERDTWPSQEKRSRLKIGNYIRLAFSVLLIAFPVPWVWIKPKPGA
ncbi:MAG: hypothetical protein COA78_32740 [Blastopirellula sp.]|nr:MAG: hypothetical protein COA78_32740 [Blastopirellula sp.]